MKPRIAGPIDATETELRLQPHHHRALARSAAEAFAGLRVGLAEMQVARFELAGQVGGDCGWLVCGDRQPTRKNDDADSYRQTLSGLTCRALSSYLSPLRHFVIAPFSVLSGFKWTLARRVQLRVLPDQRLGCLARAAW